MSLQFQISTLRLQMKALSGAEWQAANLRLIALEARLIHGGRR